MSEPRDTPAPSTASPAAGGLPVDPFAELDEPFPQILIEDDDETLARVAAVDAAHSTPMPISDTAAGGGRAGLASAIGVIHLPGGLFLMPGLWASDEPDAPPAALLMRASQGHGPIMVGKLTTEEARALSARAAGGEAVAGWRLVPVKATTPMMAAAWDHTPLDMADMTDGYFGKAYEDMLAAAPEPPAIVVAPTPDRDDAAGVLDLAAIERMLSTCMAEACTSGEFGSDYRAGNAPFWAKKILDAVRVLLTPPADVAGLIYRYGGAERWVREMQTASRPEFQKALDLRDAARSALDAAFAAKDARIAELEAALRSGAGTGVAESAAVLDWHAPTDADREAYAVFARGGLVRWMFGRWHSLMLGGETRARAIEWDVTEVASVPGMAEARDRARLASAEQGGE